MRTAIIAPAATLAIATVWPADPARAAAEESRAKSIDVVAPEPKCETEPVELNRNAGFESASRKKDYVLKSLPGGGARPTLSFVSPGAGGSRYAAKLTARAGQGGLLSRTVTIDKGQPIVFSVKVRAENIRAVQLAALPALPDRSAGGRFAPRRGRGRFGRRGRPFRRPGLRDIHRSRALSGSFDWTTLRLEATFTGNASEADFQVVVRGPGTVWVDDFSMAALWPKRVAIPAKPAAPLYVMVLMHSETPQAYLLSRDYFRADAKKFEEMAKMLHRYGARLTAQPERELWLGARRYDPGFVRRLHTKYGVSFSVHTHGPDPRRHPSVQEVLDYIRTRKRELEALGAGPVTDLNGNFDQPDWDVFADAGIRTMTAYKNRRTQRGQDAMKHYYMHPWRPAGSPYQSEQKWATHRPQCRVIYLPGAGAVHTDCHERFADLMERHLRYALSRVRPDRINVFYYVEHVGRFGPKRRGVRRQWEYVNSAQFRRDLAMHEKLFREFLAPLAKRGYVRFATPPELGALFERWERNMGLAASRSGKPASSRPERRTDAAGAQAAPAGPRGARRSSSAATAQTVPPAKGYITFVINTHDWVNLGDSADIVLRLIALFEKHHVKGDFYLTSPLVHRYARSRPDVIRRLRDSGMTISYHIRPPHILYPGFNQNLLQMAPDQMAATLRDYETYQLDLATGRLQRDQPGGYQYVAQVFHRKPVSLGVPTPRPFVRRIARRVYRELGAKMIVEYHETGAKIDRPFEYVDGLLIRPSDFSVKSWTAPGDRETFRGRGHAWWNMQLTPRAADYNPAAYLKKRLAEWSAPRPPFITCLIHENNFYRRHATPWALIYYADFRKTRPLQPPFNLHARDASFARSPRERRAIWKAYEQLVSYAAAHLKVVTSADIVSMARRAAGQDRR